MNTRLYAITRDLHLYLGLFLTPFVLVFSVSVFVLAHAWTPGVKGGAAHRAGADGWGTRDLSGGAYAVIR